MQSEAELLLEVARRLWDARSCAEMTSDRFLAYLIDMAIFRAFETLPCGSSTYNYSDESEQEAAIRVDSTIAWFPISLQPPTSSAPATALVRVRKHRPSD
jgi:hypothetical protein